VSGALARLRILDEAGRPVAGATVAVVRASVPFPEIALVADDDGVVAIRLPPGTFTFRAHGPDGRSGEATVLSPAAGEALVRIARA
jgi:protocatechuate 3,4-dioxygenase beta subunit